MTSNHKKPLITGTAKLLWLWLKIGHPRVSNVSNGWLSFSDSLLKWYECSTVGFLGIPHFRTACHSSSMRFSQLSFEGWPSKPELAETQVVSMVNLPAEPCPSLRLRLDYWHKKNSLLHGISVKNQPEQSVTSCSISGGSFILVVLVAQPMAAKTKNVSPAERWICTASLGQKRTSAGQNGRKNFRCCERKKTKLLV